MNTDERRAMALDDVPAELRRRLSSTILHAPQHRPRTPEEVEPLPALAENEEDVPIGGYDQVTIHQGLHSFTFPWLMDFWQQSFSPEGQQRLDL